MLLQLDIPELCPEVMSLNSAAALKNNNQQQQCTALFESTLRHPWSRGFISGLTSFLRFAHANIPAIPLVTLKSNQITD